MLAYGAQEYKESTPVQAEREAAGKTAAAAGEEVARLKKKLQEAAEEAEEAMRRQLADQQRVQVSEQELLTSADTELIILIFQGCRHEVHAALQPMHDTGSSTTVSTR